MDERFVDRNDAGRRLAAALEPYRGTDAVLLGLARGGVVLAAEAGRKLGLQYDVLVARKVGAPFQPEYGIGAVAPGGIRVSDPELLRRLQVSPREFDLLAEREELEIIRRLKQYRGDREPFDVAGKVAILVDDGLATGVTARAAARYVRTQMPKRVVLAVPVCSELGRELLRPEVDELICVEVPEQFRSVGQWYGDFSQLTDDDVIAALQRSERGYLA